jgi:hypothetical protein
LCAHLPSLHPALLCPEALIVHIQIKGDFIASHQRQSWHHVALVHVDPATILAGSRMVNDGVRDQPTIVTTHEQHFTSTQAGAPAARCRPQRLRCTFSQLRANIACIVRLIVTALSKGRCQSAADVAPRAKACCSHLLAVAAHAGPCRTCAPRAAVEGVAASVC